MDNGVKARSAIALVVCLGLIGCGGGGGGTGTGGGGDATRDFRVQMTWPPQNRALNLADSADLTLTNASTGAVAGHKIVNRPSADAGQMTSTTFNVPSNATYRLDVVAYRDANGAGQVMGRRQMTGLNPRTAAGIAFSGVLPNYSLSLADLPEVMHVGEPVQLTITAKDEDGQPFPLPAYPGTQWAVISSLQATVTQGGEFTPNEAGDHVVRMSLQDETGPVTYTITLHVIP